MNTAVRVLNQERLQPIIPFFDLKKHRLLNITLILLLLFSAFLVIYIKDLNRRLFIQYQTLQATHDKLYEDWGKLLLEQSTWSSQARVQKIAEHKLGMNIPSQKEVMVLKIHANT